MTARNDKTHNSGDNDHPVIVLSNINTKLTKLDRDIRSFDDKKQYFADVEKMSALFFTILSSIEKETKKVSIYITEADKYLIKNDTLAENLAKWLLEKSFAKTDEYVHGVRSGKQLY